MKIKFDFELNSNISTHMGFIILMFAGLAIALFTIHVGEGLINSMPSSALMTQQKQVEQAVNNIK